ncbi:hypothetical protein S83_001437 [Arachis hypogaea]
MPLRTLIPSSASYLTLYHSLKRSSPAVVFSVRRLRRNAAQTPDVAASVRLPIAIPFSAVHLRRFRAHPLHPEWSLSVSNSTSNAVEEAEEIAWNQLAPLGEAGGRRHSS